ncbi:MAG: hypothetical protein ACLUDU_03080 [Butyricimonas faecihominis]
MPCVKGDVLELRVFRAWNPCNRGGFRHIGPVGELYTDYGAIDLIVVRAWL